MADDATQQPAPGPDPAAQPAAPAEPAVAPTSAEAPTDAPPEAVGNAPAPAPLPDPPVNPAAPAAAAPAPAQSPDDLVSNFTKPDLQTAAAVVGADVSSSATKQDIAEAIVQATQPAPVARAVVVNNFTRRSDEDAILGSWVEVVSGDYQGRKAAYLDDLTNDPETGYPQRVLLRTRDADHMLIDVDYADVRPADYRGGR